jgi:hypothetical protein
MLTPTYSCLRCGCQIAAADVALVRAMGWHVLAESDEAASVPCLCAVCRRGPARAAGQRLDVRLPNAPAPRDAYPRAIS